MDLILLQPGDQSIFSGSDNAETVNSRFDRGTGPTGFCIELVSLHQGMKQQVTTDVSNQARTSGRPVITEFTLVKYVDNTSVKLYDYCLRAAVIGAGADQPTKIFIARNSGDKTANIITITLKDALVSEIQLQTHPDDLPTEQFKLSFTEILWTYTVQQNDTKRQDSLSSGWSLLKNKPIGALSRELP
ncbi:type VI secretion system tube protein Hcp [Undibacterium seohonense]|uniref:Type VI secretion system tube protein Hcp n=1 Tax=Undibacterium seohonense TaxID=1344950 RepID=A0ABR6X0Z8_9BURK|nr:type VI secretion system tube protein Hcp [Undibacterium seohonense]MBC3806567.1 type VI secretion system tube protein Hcp [Undibacterium seohonense]